MESALQCILGTFVPGAVGNRARPVRKAIDTTDDAEGAQPDPVTPRAPQAGADSPSLREVVLRINRDDRVAGSCRVEVVVDAAPGVATTVVQELLAQAASRVETFADRIQEQTERGATRIVVHCDSIWGDVGSSGPSAEQPFLTEAQWAAVMQAVFPLRGDRRKYRPQGVRRFIESVLWVACVDCVWSDLPPGRGSWRSVYVRFLRWSSAGIWPRVAAAMGDTSGPGRLLLERHSRYLTDAAKTRQRRRKDD
ncbi:transposase [Lysobacter arenosi]|uniref:Transposase n=1 Tax=Lysobacter arenosi TaxID=2795387 RepID=A0ABX7REK4_9GAMM|nr:transposase [Lysobacter arenosi]QSX75404.1 transposase [Lysobacter arenosi]